jgi:hypothetical protein
VKQQYFTFPSFPLFQSERGRLKLRIQTLVRVVNESQRSSARQIQLCFLLNCVEFIKRKRKVISGNVPPAVEGVADALAGQRSVPQKHGQLPISWIRFRNKTKQKKKKIIIITSKYLFVGRYKTV